MYIKSLALLSLVTSANAFSAAVPGQQQTVSTAPPVAPEAPGVPGGVIHAASVDKAPQGEVQNPTVQATAGPQPIPKNSYGGTMNEIRYDRIGPDSPGGPIFRRTTEPRRNPIITYAKGEDPVEIYSNRMAKKGDTSEGQNGGTMNDKRYDRIGPDTPYGKIMARPSQQPSSPIVAAGGAMHEKRYDKIGPDSAYGPISRRPGNPIMADVGNMPAAPKQAAPGPAAQMPFQEDPSVQIASRGRTAQSQYGGDMLDSRYDRIGPDTIYAAPGSTGPPRVPGQMPVQENPTVQIASQGQSATSQYGGDLLDRRYYRVGPDTPAGTPGSIAPPNPPGSEFQMPIQRNQQVASMAPPAENQYGGDLLDKRYDRIGPDMPY